MDGFSYLKNMIKNIVYRYIDYDHLNAPCKKIIKGCSPSKKVLLSVYASFYNGPLYIPLNKTLHSSRRRYMEWDQCD
jgi:hypothetical protein